MSLHKKCKACRKPIIITGHLTFDKNDRPYALCPYCQTVNYLPADNGNDSNPELHEKVRSKK